MIDRALPTIRVRLDRTDRATARAIIEVRGSDDNTHPVGTVATHALGLPDLIRSGRDLAETAFTVPVTAREQLHSRLAEIGASDAPAIWLDVPFPRGYLHLVPWERLLGDLPQPLLRQPTYPLRPDVPSASLRIALALSAATAMVGEAPLLPDLVRRWRDTTTRRVFVHVLTDAAPGGGALDQVAELPDVQVAVMPPDFAAAQLQTRPGAHPWPGWIRAHVQGTALDVVHLVGHGYLTGDRGELVVSGGPGVTPAAALAQEITDQEVADLLGQTGAFALVLSSAPGDDTPAALRAMADAVARNRPGCAVVHDVAADSDLDEFGAALAMMFANVPPGRALPSVTCWGRPAFAEHPEPMRTDLLDADGRSALIAPDTVEALSRDRTPTWIAAGARVIEAAQAEWAGPTGHPEDPDAVAALRDVSNLFDRHVRMQMRAGESGEPGA